MPDTSSATVKEASIAPVEPEGAPLPISSDFGDDPGFAVEFFMKTTDAASLREVDWSQPVETGRLDGVDFLSVEEPLWDDGPRDHFAARLSGTLHVAKEGEYVFF